MGLIRDALSGLNGQQQNNGYGGQQQWGQQNQYQQNQYQNQFQQQNGFNSYGGMDGYQSNGFGQQGLMPPPPRRMGPYQSSRDGAPPYSQNDPNFYNQQQGFSNQSFNSPYGNQPLPTSMASGPLQQPFAIPQTDASSSSPFLRGYSQDLADAGVDQRSFIQFVDALNLTIIPNPEMQLANTAAGLAGWFIPGLAAGIALTGVQVAAQVGGAVQTKGATKTCMQNANANIFNPCGLEVQLQTSQQLNNLLGIYSSNPNASFSLDPASRLQQYNGYISPLSSVLPPLQGAGRQDPLAQLGSSMANRKQQKQQRKAQEDAMKGKMKKANKMETGFLWMVVVNAGSFGTQGMGMGASMGMSGNGMNGGGSSGRGMYNGGNGMRGSPVSSNRSYQDDYDDDYSPSPNDRKY